MHFLILGILIFAVIFGPQVWAKRTFARYNEPQDHFPGTGGELARHLLNEVNLHDVKLEETPIGDHYDPLSKTVRLTADNLNGKSLTAIAIAAHEVGHAIQDAQNHPMLKLRTRLVQTAQFAEKIGSVAIIAAPIVTMLTRAPAAGALFFMIGIGSMFISTLVHLVTLPVEWDASFGKALPMLKAGNYLKESEMQASEKILKAAALTYVAGSLASLLNLWRWIAILRRR
ncbi:MAG: zinc metallopeptidase [Gammaproteobacteria bacterium]|nr:zinc metallopeptidase [Gammaproteobacteria bacterium]